MKLSHETTCDFCHKEASLTCGACKDSHYCDQKCQYNDFNIHKNICNIGKKLNKKTADKLVDRANKVRFYDVPNNLYGEGKEIHKQYYHTLEIMNHSTSPGKSLGNILIKDVILVMVCDMKFSLEYNYYANAFNKIEKPGKQPVYQYKIYIFINEEVESLVNYYNENQIKIKKFIEAVAKKLGKERLKEISH
jgi:hypothetical protein